MQHLYYPEDEKIHPWLTMLLGSYSITDQGVSAAIGPETSQDRKPSRHLDCVACCRSHTSTPVTPNGLVGISWHVTENVEGSTHEKSPSQLQKHKSGESCSFLVDNACSIYEFQPYACGQFNMFNQVYNEGENTYCTRKEDVLIPSQSSIHNAYFETLPFYGLEQDEGNKQKIKKGKINKVIHILQKLNWESLADKTSVHTRINS